MCYQLWPVSNSDLNACSCNTIAHYLEPHTHKYTYNGAASDHQISGEWPLHHPEATSFFLLTNKNGGLAESVMWNQGSWLYTLSLGHSWRPTETTAVAFHALSFAQTFLTLFYTIYKHQPLYMHSVLLGKIQTHLRELCGTYYVDCCCGLIILVACCMCYILGSFQSISTGHTKD